MARGLAEAKQAELSEFKDVSFGAKALAALIAYREHALGRWGAIGTAAEYWLEVGGSARLLYYAPKRAYLKAERAKAEKPTAVEEMAAEALRRLFLKPGADRHRGFVEELVKGGKLALMLERETKTSYVFKLYRLEEGGGLKELGVELWISRVGRGEEVGITYTLIFDVERWRDFFRPELEAGVKAAVEVGGRLPVEDRFPYMLGWVNSDVAITRNKKGERVLQMSTSHLWQLAETRALFGWSDIAVFRVDLTLEGPKPLFDVYTSLEKLDEAIKFSAEYEWLKILGIKAGSWDGLKQWVAKNWDVVVDAAVSRLRKVLTVEELERLLAQEGGDVSKRCKGRQAAPRNKQKDGINVWEELRRRLEALRNKLGDDKTAREVLAPALLLMQAERLGVNEETLKCIAAVISSTIGGDGYVSAALKKVELASGKRAIALLRAAVFAAHSIRTKMGGAGSASKVIVTGGDAARLAGLYFLCGHSLLEEGDERVINYKLAEAVGLGAEGFDIRWEGLRLTKSGVAADLTISEGGIAVKYNVYLRKDGIRLQFQSTDRSRAELAARLLKLAGVSAEVKRKSYEDVQYVYASTDVLAAGHEKLRKSLAEIVREAAARGWVDEKKAEGWLEKLEEGRVLREGWPKYLVRLSSSGALEVKYQSTSPDSIVQVAQRLRKMGLEEGRHFTVKMPEGNKKGYVNILKEGLAYAAFLSVHSKDEQQRRLAADFVEYILQRAEEEGKKVYEKAQKIIDEGKARGSLTLKGFEERVEVCGREYVVKVIDGEAVEEKQNGKTLLRIRITAEVDRVEGGHTIADRVVHEYKITYGRRGADNAAVGRAYASANAPDGREEGAERFSALVRALTGEEPRVYRIDNGRIMMECDGAHLDGFKRFAELADAIEEWLEETGR